MAASDTDHEIPAVEPGSYRDFTARVFYAGRRVFRGLSAASVTQWKELAQAPFFQRALQAGSIVSTTELTPADRAALAAEYPHADDAHPAPWNLWPGILEHERLPFISYPYEWSFSMLRDAALLHLDLLDAALADGFTIKDGTAFNVQWIGTRPVFLDVTSFERYRPGEPWAGYRQFCQMFLYPLMLQAYRNVAFQPWLRGHLDGVSPAEFRKLLTWRDCFRPGVFRHVVLHALLQNQNTETSRSTQRRLANTGLDQNVVRAMARNLHRTVTSLRWRSASNWTAYIHDNSYSAADRQVKADFVRNAVSQVQPRRVWDLGCNTGEYSRICADTAQYVVSLDSDHACIERLYAELKTEGRKNVLPLVWNVVDSSPNMGWRGRERKALAERGRPQLCLCLALLHHLVISASVPLPEIIDWVRELGSSVVFEFVDRHDALAARLLAGRPDDCPGYRKDLFEQLLEQSFHVQQMQPVCNGTRTLYLVRPRSE